MAYYVDLNNRIRTYTIAGHDTIRLDNGGIITPDDSRLFATKQGADKFKAEIEQDDWHEFASDD